MKSILKTSLYLLVAILVGVTAVYATSKLTPPDTVTNTMYSLTDIWNLHDGTTATLGSGTIQTTPSTIEETGKTLTQVYTDIATEIEKLSSSVIASGTTAFGIVGSESVVDTADADATEDDIISPKTAYVDGLKITGTATAGYEYPSKPLQTTLGTSNYCTDMSGNVISCTDTGQDGEFNFGQPHSYTDNADGTVTDNATGLMWQKCTVGLSGESCATGTATQMDWSTALATCNALSLAGHNDWRLPNLFELYSIVNLQYYGPAIDRTTFPNTSSNSYWSSSVSVNTTSHAWPVVFNNGSTAPNSKNIYLYLARCVR